MREDIQRLNAAINRVDAAYYSGSGDQSVSDAELCFMYALDDGHPHSQKDICRDWMLPKTTVNTIAKRFEREGLVTFTPVPGARREMTLTLTAAGESYVKDRLAFIYRAEEAAMEKTVAQFGAEFIAAIETFGAYLKQEFENQKEEVKK